VSNFNDLSIEERAARYRSVILRDYPEAKCLRSERGGTPGAASEYIAMVYAFKINSMYHIAQRTARHRASWDEWKTMSFSPEEAARLSDYLEGEQRDDNATFPSYASLVEWGKRVSCAWEREEHRKVADLLTDFDVAFDVECWRQAEREEYTDDYLEDDPGDEESAPTEHWASQVLKFSDFPPPEIPDIAPGEEVTLNQQISVERNGQKIKTKTRVLKIHVIEGE
jgi:hypothetical protein